jgi:hypothetical protein
MSLSLSEPRQTGDADDVPKFGQRDRERERQREAAKSKLDYESQTDGSIKP